jgi:hypothetical protein
MCHAAVPTCPVDRRVSVLSETFGPELGTDAEWEKQLSGNEGFVI